jgi:acyl transferase domain-containing protein
MSNLPKVIASDSARQPQLSPKEPIAIIGIGCRFPGGANSPDAFWQLLADGVDAITEVPPDRWNLPAFHDHDPTKPGKTYSRWGGFLDNIDRFDAHFFGISPREAAHIDPQQRILLELTWEALEDAGQAPERLAGTDTGVFIGLINHDYAHLLLNERDLIGPHTSLGRSMSIAANRISYIFDFRGPSMALDTACSSSLVAVHLACQNLWNGACRLALAGGVNMMLGPEGAIEYGKASMLSPTGRCHSFDARADGFVRAEGAGLVVLKSLSNALADGDPIYALIRSTAINQDGHTNGIMAPSGPAQAAMLRAAYQQAGIDPAQVQYIEAHGTGTPAGDPIEARALGAALGQHRPPGAALPVGSVKSNIGHTEAAAGIAGLIKVALALKHRQIPPHLHFQTPNPKIPFAELQLRVPQTLEPWPNPGAGALPLPDAVRVIFHRSRLLQQQTGQGKMLAVGLSLAQARQALTGYEGRAFIAAINSPNSITLSGKAEALEEIAHSLTEQQVFCRFLRVEVPFHSPLIESARTELLESIQGIRPQPTLTPLFSGVTGQKVAGSELGPDYWWQNYRDPVLFAPAIENLRQEGYDTFLEISPHPVLAISIQECLAKAEKAGATLPSLRRQEAERATLLGSLGKLYLSNIAFWTLKRTRRPRA